MGCSDCGSKHAGGCDTRKGEERQILGQTLAALYPTGRWGDPDDALWHGAGVPEHEARRLAREASEVCKAPAYFRAGEDEETCDHVYVLCVGREPGLAELLDASSVDMPDGDSIREIYLRLSLSRMLRAAAVQEVAIELQRDGDLFRLEEIPRPGVYDPVLLKRTQKLIDLAVSNRITYFDFGLLTKSPDTYDARPWDTGDYEARYGAPPGTVNYLFYAPPATARRTLWLPARAA